MCKMILLGLFEPVVCNFEGSEKNFLDMMCCHQVEDTANSTVHVECCWCVFLSFLCFC